MKAPTIRKLLEPLPAGGEGPWRIVGWNEPQGGAVRDLGGDRCLVRLVPIYACGFEGVAASRVVNVKDIPAD